MYKRCELPQANNKTKIFFEKVIFDKYDKAGLRYKCKPMKKSKRKEIKDDENAELAKPKWGNEFFNR